MLKTNFSFLSFPRKRESSGIFVKVGLVLITSGLLCFNGYSQELPKGAIQVLPEEIKWLDAPPPIPPGSKIAVLEGNPKEDGFFTMRVMIPAYYTVPAHFHKKDERVTVLEGVVYVGFGDKTDTTNASKFTEGSFYLNPSESNHYVFTQSEGCVLQITGIGPWGINYVEESSK
jgi:hypothetical protein